MADHPAEPFSGRAVTSFFAGETAATSTMKSEIILILPLLVLACAPPPQPTPPSAPAVLAQPSAQVAPAEEPIPILLLPRDTRPLSQAIELAIDPGQARFSGKVDIAVLLEKPRSVIWLTGKGLDVARAIVTPDAGGPLPATWQERDDSGVASLSLSAPIPAGKATIHVEFSARFGAGQRGLYRTVEAGQPYAFTQFEAVAAREAFPCFDEPGFKIPWAISLVVPADAQAIANTQEASRTPEGRSVRVGFARTEPLPSYLVAFAVGPLDIVPAPPVPPNAVRARPLPLRGVAPAGRGKEIGYALAHTGELLATLEAYFGIAYPWDKLDILAVPGKSGAMENAGAITFTERLLLMDPARSSVAQRRIYAAVMAHELAHQWTGDLVTMKWWDDTWLNEAFATWAAAKAADTWDPRVRAQMSLLRSTQAAMNTDSLVGARSIRQHIVSTHDIENAFDGITYHKGAAVLAMFERWIGEGLWRKGLHAYLQKHRFANASADDFLDAEDEASGKDVKTAFHSFLDQVGTPLVEASVACGPEARVQLKQSRYLPAGSTGDPNRTWQIPVCVHTSAEEACTVLTGAEGSLPLRTCPEWLLPNADAAGYYRFALAPKDAASLREHGLRSLSAREQVAYATALRSAFARGTASTMEVLEAIAPLAQAADPVVAEEPMAYLNLARDWLTDGAPRRRLEAYARELYRPEGRGLGWESAKEEDDDAHARRASVLGFLAMTGRDAAARAEAKKRGLAYLGGGRNATIHPDAVDPDLAEAAVSVVGEEADPATWSAMKDRLVGSVDEGVRGRLLVGLSVAKRADLAIAARELVLDPALRDNEVLVPLAVQTGRADTRDAAWAWLEAHFDAILGRLPQRHGLGLVVLSGRAFCDDTRAKEVEAFFAPRVGQIEGGPRGLATAVEEIRLCAAKRSLQEAGMREFFASSRAR
jgi:alanyl aminopeptidase